MRVFSVTILSCLLCSGSAFAFCMEPRAGYGLSAPQPPGAYEKPDAPDCLLGRSYGRSTLDCDDRALRDYRDQAERYAGKLETYADEAQEFARAAARYAEEAADYAACARDELGER